MTNPSPTPISLFDTWIKASWQEFITLTHDQDYQQSRFYYDCGWMKIEMSPIGVSHSQDNSIISTVIILYAALKNIPIKELTNCSYRHTGVREIQPDISYYIGDNYPQLPRNNSPIDLEEISPPSLVIENQGSYQIRESQVLPNLSITLVDQALKRSQTQDDGSITRWLMTIFA